MNEINFIPTSFTKKRARHFRVYREAAILVAMGLVIAGWRVSHRGNTSELESYTAVIEAQAAAANNQRSEVGKLQAQQRELLAALAIQRQLVLPLNVSSVMATISGLMPKSMALTSLQVTNPRPAPAPAVVRTSANGESTQTKAPPPPQIMRVDLVGLAPADVEVADFVGRLSAHPLFSNVKMPFTRAIQAGDLLAREFRIEMEVSLERDYRPANGEARKAMDEDRGTGTGAGGPQDAARTSLLVPRSSSASVQEVAHAD